MRFAVGPIAAEAGQGVLDYDTLDSTNSEALRLARDGERGPLWIVTRDQNAGRGRRGRAWISAPGNLAASFLCLETITPARAATLGFAASLAMLDTCRSLVPGVMFALKWPNDVLADGHKVGGILLESEVREGALALVTGFGLNLAQAPQGTPFPATALTAFGASIEPERAFAALSDSFTAMLRIWDRGEGFGDIRRRWLDHASGLGSAISVRIGEHVEHGIFDTLDDHGRLILQTPDGCLRTITAGDVFFGQASTAGAVA